MTKYSELYREQQAENESLRLELAKQIKKLVDEVSFLRTFIRENKLVGQLAEWATKRSTLSLHVRSEEQP